MASAVSTAGTAEWATDFNLIFCSTASGGFQSGDLPIEYRKSDMDQHGHGAHCCPERHNNKTNAFCNRRRSADCCLLILFYGFLISTGFGSGWQWLSL